MRLEPMDLSAVPLQPAMKQQLCYQERLIQWNPYSVKNLALCYEFRTGGDGGELCVIPDACLDFLFRFNDTQRSAVVTGVQTEPISLHLEPNSVYFGFKPYSSKGIRPLREDWTELTNQTVDLELQLPCEELLSRLMAAGSFSQRVSAIRGIALTQLADANYQPDFVEYSELKLCGARGNLRMEDIADYTGYTGRYCREKFKEAHGISIKRYSNIIRMQNAIRMMSAPSGVSIADVVFENGYFDQSHLNREFRLYTGETPLQYQQKLRQAAGI